VEHNFDVKNITVFANTTVEMINIYGQWQESNGDDKHNVFLSSHIILLEVFLDGQVDLVFT